MDIGGLVSGALGLASSFASAAGQIFINKKNQRFTKHMASTQYQRSVADMRAAGLNPTQLFGGGGGSPAAAPTGQMENPLSDTNSAKHALDMYLAHQTIQKVAAETDSAIANAAKAKAESAVSVKEANVINNALDLPPAQAAAVATRYGNNWLGSAASLLALGKNTTEIWGGDATAKQRAAPNNVPVKKIPDYLKNDPIFKKLGHRLSLTESGDYPLSDYDRRNLEELKALRATTGKGSTPKQRQ